MDPNLSQARFPRLRAELERSSNPSDVFFKNLPSPEQFRAAIDLPAFIKVADQVALLMIYFIRYRHEWDRPGVTIDPELDRILGVFLQQAPNGDTACFQAIETALAGIALDRSCSRSDKLPATTAKDKILAYCLWVIRGRKDDESQTLSPTNTAVVSGASSYEFLPSSGVKRGRCASCGKSGSTARCSGCSIVQDGKVIDATFYCNWDCMKAHWTTHKRACKEARGLRRSSAIFTELFLELTQYSPFTEIKSISEDKGMIVVAKNCPHRRSFCGKSVLMKFQTELTSSEEQALACRTYGRCQHILDMTRTLLEELIRPACNQIEEVHFAPKNIRKPIRTVDQSGKYVFPILCGHAAIRITTPTGRRFALDPTGAQHGWREYLAPWDAYERHRIHLIDEVTLVRPGSPPTRNMNTVYKPNGVMKTEAEHCMLVMAECLAARAGHYASRHLGYREMSRLVLGAPEAEFVPAKGLLVGDAKMFLAEYYALVEKSWMQKWYLDMNLRPYSTRSEKAFDSLRKVWLTEAELEGIVGLERRAAVWRGRFSKLGNSLPENDGLILGQECRVINSMLACGLCEVEGVQAQEGIGSHR